ncbi:MAG: hypothetical protein MUO82_06310 [Candidatus Thermoplasmatota archaeon]|nr:hypothetical protein [Candidatus Thermoplasmatota archaeon]
MKKQILIFGITLIFITTGLSGCTQQDSSSDQSTDQITLHVTESIQTILAKTETMESMYYEIISSINMPQFGTQTAMIKIWQKKPYLKAQTTSTVNGITNTIMVIQRPEGIYNYDYEEGKYVLTTDNTSFVASLQYFDNEMIKTYLNNQTSTNFETEIIDGKKATIIQYTPPDGGNLMTIKIWIWNEKGVPLKATIDMKMEEITMMMDFIFSNYSFSEIPDSTFSVI